MRLPLFLLVMPALAAAPLVAQAGATLDLRVGETPGGRSATCGRTCWRRIRWGA